MDLHQAVVAFLLLLLAALGRGSDAEPLLFDTEVSYVMEPFEWIDNQWFISGDNETIMLSQSDDALFENQALQLEYNISGGGNISESVNFGWIQQGRPHNCYGAAYVSMWYKPIKALSRHEHLRLSMLGVRTLCSAMNQTDCSTSSSAGEWITVIDHVLDGAVEEWLELVAPIPEGMDLLQIRGWQVEVISSADAASSASQFTGTILLDQLAFYGGGEMFSAPLHLPNGLDFVTSIQNGVWSASYFQSPTSENKTSTSMLNGVFSVNYTVEMVEDWGGFVEFTHLAPGSSYYNLSRATDVAIDYEINLPSSSPERAIMRMVLQDTSDCVEVCDDGSFRHERYYSFNDILDDQGTGQIVLPLQGSADPADPFWLTGWSGIIGNGILDSTKLKGYSLEIVLDSVLPRNSMVSGGVVFNRIAAVESSTSRVDVRMSYVIDPFESVSNEWFRATDSGMFLNYNLSDDSLFASHSLGVQYIVEPDQLVNFGWVQPLTPYNCYGASYFSLWYKIVDQQSSSAIRVAVFDDSNCGSTANISCSDPDNLMEYVVIEQTLDGMVGVWRELKGTPSRQLNLSRLRGWKVEIVGIEGSNSYSGEHSGVLRIDQLACHGNGNMMSAVLSIGDDVDFERAVAEQTWIETFFQSEISRDESDISIEDGHLRVNYTVQQVEAWGGFIDMGHLPPGQAYYNLSQATHLLLDYDVSQVSSSPGRAIFRFVLQDNSNCAPYCAINYIAYERYYSFNAILDEQGKGKLDFELEGSGDPASRFWLTGWSGIIGNGFLDSSNLKGFVFEIVLDSQLEFGSLVSGVVQFYNLTAAYIGEGDIVHDEQVDVGAQCVPETDLFLIESAPQITRVEFLANECCQLCADDPECLYALSNGRDCFLAPYLDPSSVGLLTTATQRESVVSFWVDDPKKRGDFCEVCVCSEVDRMIDCSGRDLAIVPKTFGPSTWTARVLDLTRNPRLVLLGSDSLSSIAETLEELWLPNALRHLALKSVRDLPVLQSVLFEEDIIDGRSSLQSTLNNVIVEPSGSYGDVCCSRGANVQLRLPENGLTFCNFMVDTPGSDAVYDPFVMYENAEVIQTLTPSSPFMSEASDSVEKCAEYCAISAGCLYFQYDARLPNAEHYCQLLANNGTNAETICCHEDHFADFGRTIPGWTSGKPPRTRHDYYNASVITFPTRLQATTGNSYIVQYEVSLGANPLRGAVWVEPTLASTVKELNVTFSPSRVVLYDSEVSKVILVQIENVIEGTPPSSIVVQNAIVSCDAAFGGFSVSVDGNTVFVDVLPPLILSADDNDTVILVSLVLVAIVVVVLALAFILRKSHNDSIWKVKLEELKFDDPPVIVGRGTFGFVLLAEFRGTQVAVKRAIEGRKIRSKSARGISMVFDGSDDISMDEGSMRDRSGSASGLMSGSLRRTSSVTMTKAKKKTWKQLRKDFVEEMRYLSKLRHPCITTVMGAVMGKNVEPMLIMEYMEHGSLYDILHNETMVLEGELLLPILQDIAQGLRFLHSATPAIIHGDLKAANILVDSKFRAKVVDFGLSQKKSSGVRTGTPFWMAPEVLLGETGNTEQSDMYAFGIILYEVYSRKDPYEGEDTEEVLNLVVDYTVNKRPEVPPSCPSQLQSLMLDCVHADPTKRPVARELDIRLKRVDVDTATPQEASVKTTITLFDIFPRHIAEALQEGRKVEPEHKDVVTIFFSDIVGFTTIASTLPPGKVADLLDRLYHKFDELSHKYDVFKVETIGDAYMAVTNLVKDQESDHAKRIANFAIEAIQVANSTLIDVDDIDQGVVNIRAGFHSGPVVADVVGNRNPRYCLFGDSVNTASRMESNSEQNRIHCSDTAAGILRSQYEELPLLPRGRVHIKGKGDMSTYWVNEEEGVERTRTIRFQEDTLPASVGETKDDCLSVSMGSSQSVAVDGENILEKLPAKPQLEPPGPKERNENTIKKDWDEWNDEVSV